MIFGLVRKKADSARPKNFVKFLFPIFIGLLVAIVGQSTVAPPANASIFGTGYNAAYAGGGGGNQNGTNACPANMVAVGVGFTVNGNSPGFGVYCRTMGTDGQLVAQDQSSISNTSAVGGGNTRVFCAPGQVVTGISFRWWTNVRIRCATPPALSDNAQTAWALAATGTEIFTNCSANGIVAGFYTRTGAWTDAIGAYCLPFSLNTLSYNVNGGSGTAPASQTQTAPAQQLTVTSAYAGTRTGFTLSGWNTQANGLGITYANGSSIRPVGATTLFARWTSTITYDGNTHGSGTVPSSTTAVSSAAVTNLAHNSGSLAKSGFTFVGWNTLANGAGTSYPASNPPLLTETPYMHFDAENFNDSTNAWTDLAATPRNISGTTLTSSAGNIRGNPTKVTNTAGANGSSKEFPAVVGTTADGIMIGNGALTNFTFCHVARYAGSTRGRIFAGTTGNWLSGYWNFQAGVAHPGNWITSSAGTNDTNWRVMCQTGGSVSRFSSNGVDRTTVSNNTSGMPADISINLQGSRTSPGDLSDWAVAEFIIYDSVLSTNKVQEIEERLNRKYGISAYTSAIHTYTYASTGNITLYAQWNSTITYNGNGQTSASSTVPAPTIAKGTAGNTTLANAGTMVRSGFAFAGWNTQADGLGTNYASGLTTYASTGNITLYARWTATITFDPNGASGSPATSSTNTTPKTSQVFINSISSIPLGDLPTVGTMSRPGFTFVGWNTAANGSGTRFSGSSSSTPILRYLASDYDTSTVTWANSGSAGSAFNITSSSMEAGAGITKINSASQGGSSASFTTLRGTTSSKITFPNSAMSSYTLCHVARYVNPGSSTGTKQRIFTHPSNNWLSGYLVGMTGYYYGSGNDGSVAQGNGDTNWHLICDYNGNFRNNGRSASPAGRTSLPANIGVATWSNQQSDWEIAEVLFYSHALSTFQIEALEASLKSTYGLSSLYQDPSTPATAGSYLATGNVTLYAQWVANDYAITYDTAGTTGGAMAQTFATAGSAVSLRTNAFTRTGHTFKNWNTAANGSGTTYTNGQSVTLFNNLLLYPQWNLIAPGAPTLSVVPGNTEVTITPTPVAASGTSVGATTSMLVTTFNSGGGALTAATISRKSLASNVATLTTSAAHGFNPGMTVTVTNVDSTFNGVYTITTVPNTTSFTFAKTASDVVSATATGTATPSATCSVVLPATSCLIRGLTNGTTYTFSATATNATGTSAASSRVNGVPFGVAVTFDATTNSGAIGSATITNRSITSNVATLTTSSPHGLTAGMAVVVANVASPFNGTFVIDTVPSPTTFNYALTASNVTAISSSGTVTMSTTYTFNKGLARTLPSASRSGYTFAGWYTGSSSGTLVGGSGASHSPLVSVSITNKSLTSNVATLTSSTPHGLAIGNEVVIANVDSTFNGTFTITAVPSTTTFSYAKTASNVSTTSVSPAGVSTTSKITLYAQYVGLTYTISYNGNGNTGGTIPGNATYQVGGSSHTVLGGTDAPTKTGYTFAGWSTGITPYYPSGPQLNVALSNLSNGGWNRCYGDLYSQAINVSLMKSSCTGTYLIFAAAEIGTAGDSSTIKANNIYVLAAGERSKIFTATTQNGTTLSNGSYWFHTDGLSLGFDDDSSISQGQCFQDSKSVCWHWVSGGAGGYSAHDQIPSTSANWVRHVYQTNQIVGSLNVGDSITTNSNIILTAKWTANTNTISYNVNSGSGSAPSSGSYVTGASTAYTVLAKPDGLTKTGSEFIGWNTAADGSGNSYSAGAALTAATDVVLYAQWRANTYSYSYQLNGGTSVQPSSGTASYNASITLPAAPTREGFTFAGWNNGSSTSNASALVSITSNSIFVAQWSAQSFSITYDGNGSSSGSVTAGSYVAGGVPYAIAANGFTRAGYNFAGWHTTAGGTGGTDYVAGAGYSTAANLVLYAKWTPASYTITYNGNGSTSGTVPNAGTLTTGTTFNANNNSGLLVKTGYTFAGWNTAANGTGTAIASNGLVTTTANLTLYAQWTVISPLITFDKGIATTANLPSNTSAQYGSLFTLPATDTATVISSVNYIFTGWKSGNATYAVGDKYRMSESNVTFTAQWVALYDVTYVYGDGLTVDAKDEECVTASLCINNQSITTRSAPSRTGYNFTHWRDQSGTTVSGNASYTVTDGHYVLYAIWAPIERTLSFGLDSGSGTAPTDITGKIIGEIVTLPTTSSTKAGYTFGGWSTGGVTYPAGGTITIGTANITFTAVWVGNTNTITYNANGATSGTAPSNGTHVTGGSTHTIASNSGTLAKTGFSFVGWNTAANGSGEDKAENATGFTTTSDITLYAKWSAASYTVTYVTGVGASAAPTPSNTMYGASFNLPAAPTRTGYNFIGWEVGSAGNATLIAPGASYTMGSSAVTFTAKWSGLSYVVVYQLNGGAGSAPTQADVSHGESFTTAAAATRNGFTFSGWSDGATLINPSTSVTNVTANKTLTAQWTVAVPGIPGAPTAVPGDGSATITVVSPSSGGTPASYTITASPGGATCQVISPATSCTISSLTNGTSYTFTSSASNTTGSSSASSTSSAVVPAGLPSEPLGVSGSGTGGTVSLTWNLPDSDGGTPITDYIVEYRVATSGTWATFADGVSTARSATVSGLIAGNEYEFRVTAKNAIGNSQPSLTSPIVESLPLPPSAPTVVAGSEEVTVSWNAPTHLGSGTLTGSEYVVTAYDANGDDAGSCSPTTGQRTCVVSGLRNGSAYTFKVVVVTTVATSDLSAASATAIPAGVPSAPANVAAVTSGSNMTITFDAPADNGGSAITSYLITSSPAGATCTAGANATTYTCSGLAAGTNYTYSVKAVNSKGQSSASLDSTAVMAVAAPSAPQNVSAVITAGTTTLSATVSFNAPTTDNGSAVISYRVTASPGGATCTVNAPTTYCEIPVLPDRVYTFTVTATNAVGTSVSSSASLETKAANGIAPTLVVDPIPAPTGDLAENKVLSSNITFADFNSTPNSIVTYQWKRCIDPLDDTTCTSISGAINATYTLTNGDVDKYIRVAITATNSIDTITKLSDATEKIIAAPTNQSTTTNPPTPTCDAACQAVRDAAAAKALADAAAKIAADKLAADAAAKLKADAAAIAASNKAAADAAAAAAAAKAAVEKAGAAAAAKAAADAAALTAAAQAKAAADAQAAANKAAAAAAAALKNSTTTAAAKAAATASAQKAADAAAAAVKAAAAAATNAAKAQSTAANASKQVDIAINSLNSKTAASQSSAQANAIAAAAKAAANEAAATAAEKAAQAKATAAAAQKVAADTAARIATEQREAALAAVAAKAAADAAAKATAEKIAATNAAKVATENLVKVLDEKAALADQAAKATTEEARAEINKKIEEIANKVNDAQRITEEATNKADDAIEAQEEATDAAEEAFEAAETQAAEAVAVKTESSVKNAAATRAVTAATVAEKVATAAKAAAAKVPSKAVIATKPSTSTNKNSATATVTGLKPGQKVKVTVNVKPR